MLLLLKLLKLCKCSMLIKSTLALKCLSYFHSSSVLILYRHSHQVYQNVCVHERSTARLECEMSSKDVHIHWLKDGCDITASGRYIFMREGKRAESVSWLMRESTLLSALRTTMHTNMSSLLKSLWLVRILLYREKEPLNFLGP